MFGMEKQKRLMFLKLVPDPLALKDPPVLMTSDKQSY